MSTLLPEVITSHIENNGRLVLTLHIQPELDYFAGHFPGLPLLPGVVQVDWAVRLGKDHLGLNGDFGSLDNLKFQSMIFPGATVALMLEWQAATGRLNFEYRQGEQVASSGRISFRSGATA